jgi:hypothetical protein
MIYSVKGISDKYHYTIAQPACLRYIQRIELTEVIQQHFIEQGETAVMGRLSPKQAANR